MQIIAYSLSADLARSLTVGSVHELVLCFGPRFQASSLPRLKHSDLFAVVGAENFDDVLLAHGDCSNAFK